MALLVFLGLDRPLEIGHFFFFLQKEFLFISKKDKLKFFF